MVSVDNPVTFTFICQRFKVTTIMITDADLTTVMSTREASDGKEFL